VRMTERLRTGELARIAGVSNDTIRHYEKMGVIPSATREANGYRSYSPDAIERVRVVRAALQIGFTLEEIARIFRQRASGRPPCRDVRALGASKLEALEERIAALIALRDTLAATIETWDARLERTTQGHTAHLLETLIERRDS
jgi:DNA-binding transcriptional MerR regulator